MLSRPASATLSDPVKVRTMIRPKRTSETRSIGSNTRLEDRSKELSGMGRWKLNLLRGLQFETVAKQPADNNEKDAGRCAERRQCHKQGPDADLKQVNNNQEPRDPNQQPCN